MLPLGIYWMVHMGNRVSWWHLSQALAEYKPLAILAVSRIINPLQEIHAPAHVKKQAVSVGGSQTFSVFGFGIHGPSTDTIVIIFRRVGDATT